MAIRLLGSLLLGVLQGCFLSHQREPDVGAELSVDAADEADDRGRAMRPTVAAEMPDLEEPEPEICSMRRYAPLPSRTPVDVIWVIDSSQSMEDERMRVSDTINKFVQDVEVQDADVRVVMINFDDIVPGPLGDDPDRYLFVQRYVDSEEPLQALIEHLPDYINFLRPGAYPHFIVVTDDESDMSADAFLDTMTRAVGPFAFHAVASPDNEGFPCRSPTPTQQCILYGARYPSVCGAANPGVQYYDLADATGGEQISVCDEDWVMVFALLAEAVLEPIPVPCTVGLGERPDGLPYDQVFAWVEGGELVELDEVASPDACSEDRPGFYRMSEGVDGFTLCPSVCEQLTDSMGTLILELDCSVVGEPGVMLD